MNDPIGIGIIGAGFMGMLHARVFSQISGAQVTALYDPALKEPPLLGDPPKAPGLCRSH